MIDAVVFDLGGVLVELGSLGDILAGAGLPADQISERWILSDAVRRFERGRCDVDEFAAGLVEEFGLTISPDEAIERVASLPKGMFDGSEQLIAEVRSSGRTVAALSNTNALHWDRRLASDPIDELFDRVYVSHQLDMVKPDREIFDHVASDLGLAPERILFIDDNKVNTDGAIVAGFAGAVCKGPVETRASLVEFGVLTT